MQRTLPQIPTYMLPQTPTYMLPQTPTYMLPQTPTYMLPQICNLRYITGYENMADYKSAITQDINSYENTAIYNQLQEYGRLQICHNTKLIVKNGTGN
jgi:hypothetical protein